MRVVAHAAGEERKALHERFPVGAALEIGLGPGRAVRPIEREDRGVDPVEDLLGFQFARGDRGADLDGLGVADALLVPSRPVDIGGSEIEQLQLLLVLEIVEEPAERVEILVTVLRQREIVDALRLQDDLRIGDLHRVEDPARALAGFEVF